MSYSQSELADFQLPNLQDLLKLTLPPKSLGLYIQAWNDFVQHQIISEDTIPKEGHYLAYLTHLRKVKKYRGSSLWCIYSKLNACHQRLYGQRLQDWPRIKIFVQGCQSGESVKKASVFTTDELEAFARNSLNVSKYWMVRKAVIAVAYFGGHRTCELRSLKLKNLEIKKDGVEIVCQRAKQRGIIENSKYFIPKATQAAQMSGSVCWATIVEVYLKTLRMDVPNFDPNGPVFLSVRKSVNARFMIVPIGKNQLAKVGKEVAIALLKPNPDDFTGHCWRLTAATAAANNGATSLQMRSHFAWKSDNMCREYVDNAGITICNMGNILVPKPNECSSTKLEEKAVPSTSSMDVEEQQPWASTTAGEKKQGQKSTTNESRNLEQASISHEINCCPGSINMTGCNNITVIFHKK